MQKTLRAAALVAVLLSLRAALLTAAPEKTQTAAGSVTRVEAAERTVHVALSDGPETAFAWNAETRINGTLTPGARVTIRYSVQPNGQNLAHQISVARN
jgi:hypothetical protein